MARSKPSNMKATPLWILVALFGLVGTVAGMLYVLTTDNQHKAYTLLFLIPVLGPIIAYVLTSSKDKYISTLSQWYFIGQLVGGVVAVILSFYLPYLFIRLI